MTTPKNLYRVFSKSAARCPERPALEVDGRTHSYAALGEDAKRIAATLQRARAHDGPPLTVLLAQRTHAAFAGILGTLASGHGYVPILPTFPVQRALSMLQRSRAREVCVDSAGMTHLPDLLAACADPMTVVSIDSEFEPELTARFDQHHFVSPANLAPATEAREPTAGDDDIAYVLFTSGSTGTPKGVMVSHANIERFLDVVVERYDLRESDRFSHMFDLTFDLSLFDLFASWKVGGCLCCPGSRDRLLPARYVNDAKISIWFSVPSTALLMKKTRTLTEDAFEGLRWSLFCGEALPVEVAQAWRSSAPNSRVENIYGPTEVTLACTGYMCDARIDALGGDEIVPIGKAFPGLTTRVANEDLTQVEPGEDGELLMAGPQVALGYWDDPERTAAVFVVPPGETERFYRTGDRVRRPLGDEPLRFLGRVDQQIKVRGYRVELGEVEAVMRREAGVDAAIAVGWPRSASGADGIVGFVDDAGADIPALTDALRQHLPAYMVPREIRTVESFPLNANGKIDRKALLATLQ